MSDSSDNDDVQIQDAPAATGPPAHEQTGETPKWAVTPEQRDWILREYLDSNEAVKGSRGNKSGYNAKVHARTVVYAAFVKEFCADWSKSRIERYEDTMKKKIYTVFSTYYRRRHAAEESLKSADKKVSAVNLWAKDSGIKGEVEEGTPRNLVIAQRQSKVCTEFRNLPPDQKSHWKTKAVEKRIENRSLVRVKDEDLEPYVDGWVERLNGLVAEGHIKAGISFVGFFAYEGFDAQKSPCHHVKDYVSADIKEYAQSEEFADAYSGYTNWYRDTKGAVIPGKSPVVAVVPNPTDFYRPRYPEIGDKPRAHTVRDWNRQYINAEYGFTGGFGGATPWKEISDAYARGEIRLWIPNWPADLPFNDPSRLSHAENLRIASLLRKTQDGSPDQGFWFAQVIYGTTAPGPECTASRVTTIEQGDQQLYVLHFDSRVTKPQSTRPVPYHESCWRYYYYLVEERNLEHWMGLGSVPNIPAVDVIPPDAFDFVRSILDAKDPQLCSKILRFFETINAIEHHGPIKTSQGIWDLSNALEPLPSLFPSSKPKDVRAAIVALLLDFWLPALHYLSTFMAEHQGFGKHVTLDWLFSWLDSIKHSSFIHQRSNTVQAGDAGVVWPGVVLAKALLNAAVAYLHIDPPKPAPPTLDLDRIGKLEYPRLLDQLDSWSALCSQSLEILSKTSHERMHAVDADADAEPVRDDVDDDEGSSVDEPNRSPDLRVDPKGKGKGKAQRVTQAKAAPKARRRTFHELDQGASELVILSSNEDTDEAPVVDQAFFEPGPVSEDWTSRTHIFGFFAPQPDVPEHTGLPQDLLVDGGQVLGEAQQAIERWQRFDDTCGIHYPGPAITHAKMLAQRAPLEEIRPILVGILLHRYDMNHATALWPRVQQLSQSVLLACRKASQIFKAIDRLFSTEFSSRTGPLKHRLQQTRGSLQLVILKSRAIFHPLSEMQSLATRYANDYQNEWNSELFSLGLNRQISLAHALAQWRDDTQSTARDHRNFFTCKWRDHELPKDQQPPSIRFRFGCPRPDIFDGAALSLLSNNPRGQLLISPEPEPEQDPSVSSNVAAVDSPRRPSVPLAGSPARSGVVGAVGPVDSPNYPSGAPQYTVSASSILPESGSGATTVRAPAGSPSANRGQSPTTSTTPTTLNDLNPPANPVGVDHPTTPAETGDDQAADVLVEPPATETPPADPTSKSVEGASSASTVTGNNAGVQPADEQSGDGASSEHAERAELADTQGAN
ncbi:hypothetical protein FS749_007236 [Ceratobasidium sp. UAMH 11750]|nr:hypothetical protein FS749_007236 [Ceratobasidium sp. UAMH 11750]